MHWNVPLLKEVKKIWQYPEGIVFSLKIGSFVKLVSDCVVVLRDICVYVWADAGLQMIFQMNDMCKKCTEYVCEIDLWLYCRIDGPEWKMWCYMLRTTSNQDTMWQNTITRSDKGMLFMHLTWFYQRRVSKNYVLRRMKLILWDGIHLWFYIQQTYLWLRI